MHHAKSRVLVSLFFKQENIGQVNFLCILQKTGVLYNYAFESFWPEYLRAMAPSPFPSEPFLRCSQKPSLGQGKCVHLSQAHCFTRGELMMFWMVSSCVSHVVLGSSSFESQKMERPSISVISPTSPGALRDAPQVLPGQLSVSIFCFS